MENCKNCVCLICDANNKIHSTSPLNTCYGCDGKDEKCTKPMSKKDCLYQLKNLIKSD